MDSKGQRRKIRGKNVLKKVLKSSGKQMLVVLLETFTMGIKKMGEI